ncbi:hypothetical protein [Streptomyces sp. NPDC058371]|jgi:hypothetical protein|uniref:hypothetical protein n=1 Tax=Streptomyces sp. NPDC058371 TaxID=3346463 RepID=UPI003650B5EC
MRTTRALAVTAVAAAVVGLAAPAASAWDSPSNIVAMPSVIARGGQLTVTVDGSSCHMSGSTISSPVFPTVPLRHVSGNTASATVTIDRNARPGSYDITAHCGERRSLTRPAAFTVIGGVRGGLGGSTSSGATPTDMAIGGGLVAAAAVGGGVFWMRRRSEKRV